MADTKGKGKKKRCQLQSPPESVIKIQDPNKKIGFLGPLIGLNICAGN